MINSKVDFWKWYWLDDNSVFSSEVTLTVKYYQESYWKKFCS